MSKQVFWSKEAFASPDESTVHRKVKFLKEAEATTVYVSNFDNIRHDLQLTHLSYKATIFHFSQVSLTVLKL